MLFKSYQSRHREILIEAFITYVRPLVEVNVYFVVSTVWSPHLIRDIRLIESVQHRFMKNLRGLRSVSYSDRRPIASRGASHIKADLLFTCKLVFGLTSLKAFDYFRISTIVCMLLNSEMNYLSILIFLISVDLQNH